MILLDLKNYIKQHHQVTLMEIKNHFDLTEDAALGLLNPLIQQGFIQFLDESDCSSGQCATACQQNSLGGSYQWLGKPLKKLSIPIEII